MSTKPLCVKALANWVTSKQKAVSLEKCRGLRSRIQKLARKDPWPQYTGTSAVHKPTVFAFSANLKNAPFAQMKNLRLTINSLSLMFSCISHPLPALPNKHIISDFIGHFFRFVMPKYVYDIFHAGIIPKIPCQRSVIHNRRLSFSTTIIIIRFRFILILRFI